MTGPDAGVDESVRQQILHRVLFAGHPMIVFYGSNGMSEAPFVFFITWAVRRLMMWMVDDDVHHLVAAGGIAMGLAYLARYDALACIGAAGLVVAATTYRRAPRPPRVRRALLDLIIISGPGWVAFAGWAITGWLITGEGFAQFTSQYGNSAILRQSGAHGAGLVGGLSFAATCTLLLAPTLAPLAMWAGLIRWRRPGASMLVPPLAVFGAALAFQAVTFAAGGTFAFLRFYIIGIRGEVPAGRPTHRARGVRRTQQALPDALRRRRRHRHPGTGDPQ